MGVPVSHRSMDLRKNVSLIVMEKIEPKIDFICFCPEGFTGLRCEISKFLNILFYPEI
jgi:hypothetical protein